VEATPRIVQQKYTAIRLADGKGGKAR